MPVDKGAVAADIAAKIADYRLGEIQQPTREHVLRWVGQFDAASQEGVLVETRRFLSQMYASKQVVEKFVAGLTVSNKVAGADPRAFWAGVGFLKLQRNSQSQRDMLSLLSGVLTAQFGLNCDRELSTTATYVYIDDATFTGRQVLTDIKRWIESNNIRDVHIHLIFIGLHKSGFWYADKELKKLASPRRIALHWWRAAEIEDWKKPANVTSVAVLWPTHFSNDPYVQRWLAASPNDQVYFNPRPTLTPPAQNPFFTSEANRILLEQTFLQCGAYIVSLSRQNNPHMHPLGYHSLNGPGFGTLFATYRNCPNNCPLVLWWGDPNAGQPLNQWHPLLPRRTRAQNWAADFDEVDF